MFRVLRRCKSDVWMNRRAWNLAYLLIDLTAVSAAAALTAEPKAAATPAHQRYADLVKHCLNQLLKHAHCSDRLRSKIVQLTEWKRLKKEKLNNCHSEKRLLQNSLHNISRHGGSKMCKMTSTADMHPAQCFTHGS